MTDLFFPDYSEWQAAGRPTGIPAVLVRVSHGTTLDKCMPARRDQARSDGHGVIGWYLFLNHAPDVFAQVATFASVIPTLADNEFVMLDWERDDWGVTPPVAMRDAALTVLDQRYGRKTVGYGYVAELASAPYVNRPVIVAAYGTTEPSIPHVGWQFTNGIYASPPYQPISWPTLGRIDSNVFHGSLDQFKAALGMPITAPPLHPPTFERHGDIMLYSIPIPTDAQGNGWQPTNINWSSWNGAVSVEGSDPGVDKVYWPGAAHAQERDGNVFVSVTGALPGAVVHVFVGANDAPLEGVEGPRGGVGPAGPPGPDGPQGPAGTPGVAADIDPRLDSWIKTFPLSSASATP